MYWNFLQKNLSMGPGLRGALTGCLDRPHGTIWERPWDAPASKIEETVQG